MNKGFAAMFGDGDPSTTFIIVLVALAIILLIFILAIALCCARWKKRQIAKIAKKRNQSISTTKKASVATTTTTTKKLAVAPPSLSEQISLNRGAVAAGPKIPSKIQPLSRPPQSQTSIQPQSYFGTIQSTADDMDDVSTLGDPFMVMGGDAHARMDADNTVGERYVVIYSILVFSLCRSSDRNGSHFSIALFCNFFPDTA